MSIAEKGGLLSAEQLRAAWRAHPKCRTMLEAVAYLQRDGWAA
ncbi:hypothetical protein [Corynebacterium atrinae]|nr:hypothetical protein [Corynebacterium atrinae]